MTEDKGRIIALGTFDGVHIGHRALIDTAMRLGKEKCAPAAIYTFTTHPMELFNRAPALIMPDSERLAYLSTFGLEVIAEEFTPALAALPPEAFTQRLKNEFDIGVAVAGFNYSFGAGGRGSISELSRLGGEYGFSVCEIAPEYYAGEVVSSTRIRACLKAGDIASVNAMLGRRYALSGEVVKNRHIGSSIGFPTANIAWDAAGIRQLPATGVYATLAYTDGGAYKAVTNVGKNPTVGGSHTTVETHLIDYDRDLYGRALRVEFASRLRGEVRFSSLDELAAQITRDVETAKNVL